MKYPPKLKKGDKVAILSLSKGLPEIFPHVFEYGLKRLKEEFDLIPVEYPTTRKMLSSVVDRVRDFHNALLDPEIKGIITSIGGDDQIKLLKYIDKDVVRSNPKMFMGYSDATNIELFLWNLGIVSYYGGAIMVQFAMNNSMFDYTTESINKAFFEKAEFELTSTPEYTEDGLDWGNPKLLTEKRNMFPNIPWEWVNANKVIKGITWGGCLEIIDFNLRAGKYLPDLKELKGKILFIETSEERPDDTYVYRVLMGMGERGLLEQFSALLVGRAKASEFNDPKTLTERNDFRVKQGVAILQAMMEYNPKATIVFNLDIGHTDPQFILPNGGNIRIDGINKKIFVKY